MIYVRTGLLRSAAGAVVLWVGTVLATLFLFAAALRSQDSAAPPKAAAEQPPKAAAETPAKAETAKAAVQLGLVLAEATKVRCFASDLSPSFEDALQKGAVVALGKTDSGFCQVLLPFGPVGYVNKKFASPQAAGVVKAVGKGVSFRYRPKTGEAPVMNLQDGQELVVLGEQEDWWRVRCAACECWLPQAEVQAFAEPPDTMQLTYAELKKAHQAEIDAWLAKMAAADEKVKLDQAQQQKLAGFQEEFRKIGAQPLAAQDYSALEQGLTAFEQELGTEAAALAGVKALQKRIADRKWVVEAAAIRSEVAPPAKDLPVVQAAVPDALARFDAIGWLRLHKPLGRAGYYTIEKGEQVLYQVTCSSGRYDLPQFVDQEVGMIGPRQRLGVDSMRVLDVTKIEVLGLSGR
jgi:hypothetical protein